ncbi:MAG: LysE family translocator [Spirochaetota bacterium]|nr:MAG: LysE family translocator [Spirochaetota bacterium]
MGESIQFLTSGIVFGSVAGITPGPLLALVISETIKHDRRKGISVAFAPLITDLPIVFASVFILAKLAHYQLILGIISIAGATFICYLAYESFRVKGIELCGSEGGVRSLRKGIITNLLNPSPYIFWITVLAPTTIRAYTINIVAAVFFVLGFYLFLIGSKIIVSVIVDKSKRFIKDRVYLYIIRSLGVALLVFAFLFIRDGLKFLGIFT